MRIPFAEKINKILEDGGYNYKTRVFTKNRDYIKFIIYGRFVDNLAQRRSKKLVAYKDEKGNWQGDMEAVKVQGEKGSAIYLMDYHDKKEQLKYEVYSDIWQENGEEYSKKELLKVMQGWRETEKLHNIKV
jgi:hypothetical protein